MSQTLPEHVVDLQELPDDRDRALYVPSGDGGFQLCRERVEIVAALEAKHAAELAEIERRQALLTGQMIEVEARRALTAAGANPDLLDGAVALFLLHPSLRVEGAATDPRVVLDPGECVLLGVARMNRLLEIDTANRVIRVDRAHEPESSPRPK